MKSEKLAARGLLLLMLILAFLALCLINWKIYLFGMLVLFLSIWIGIWAYLKVCCIFERDNRSEF